VAVVVPSMVESLASWVEWVWVSDGGLALRVCAGLLVLGGFLAVDVVRKGWAGSRRVREYGFLGMAALAAAAYGVLNDLVTVGVSWEYFYYGKELGERFGYELPPDLAALRTAALVLGAKASWSAGLIFGLALVVANNPGRVGPELAFGRLARLLPLLVVATASAALVGGLLGWGGAFDGVWSALGSGQAWIRPRPFLSVWGAHLGAYVGGVAACGAAVVWVRRRRRALGAQERAAPSGPAPLPCGGDEGR